MRRATLLMPALYDTIRRSICGKIPEIARLDQVESALVWTSTMVPASRRSAVISGVPSASLAQTFLSRSIDGSARICRLTATSLGISRPANGLVSGTGASGAGSVQAIVPDSERPPVRNCVGSSGSMIDRIGRRQPGTGQAQQQPAAGDPGCHGALVARRQRHRIRDDQHGRLALAAASADRRRSEPRRRAAALFADRRRRSAARSSSPPPGIVAMATGRSRQRSSSRIVPPTVGAIPPGRSARFRYEPRSAGRSAGAPRCRRRRRRPRLRRAPCRRRRGRPAIATPPDRRPARRTLTANSCPGSGGRTRRGKLAGVRNADARRRQSARPRVASVSAPLLSTPSLSHSAAERPSNRPSTCRRRRRGRRPRLPAPTPRRCAWLRRRRAGRSRSADRPRRGAPSAPERHSCRRVRRDRSPPAGPCGSRARIRTAAQPLSTTMISGPVSGRRRAGAQDRSGQRHDQQRRQQQAHQK